MLSVSRTYLEMPVIIHEFATQVGPAAAAGRAAAWQGQPCCCSLLLHCGGVL